MPVTPVPSTTVDPVASLVTALTAATTALTTAMTTYARRRMYDVRDYTSTDDMGAAINRAITAAAADTYTYGKPGQVVLPPMNEAITTEIVPINGVDLIGSGWGKTVLRPQTTKSAIKRLGASSSDYLHDVLFADFEIDGSEQVGTYASSIKGIYITYLLRVNFDNLYIHDTGATGLGCDYFRQSWIRNVTANSCGRLNDGAHPGGAGIGIGTGNFPSLVGGAVNVEDLSVTDCQTDANGRCGLFFETQSGSLYQGVKVVNHHAHGNGEHGIADAGCDGLQVVGGYTAANTGSGFAAYGGTVATGVPGKNGVVTGLQSRNNTQQGFIYDNTGTNEGAGAYTFADCGASGNTLHGMAWVADGSDVPNMTVRDSRFRANAEAGIRISSTGAGVFTDATIQDCEVIANNTGAGGYGGISLNSNLTRPRIMGGRSGNSGGSTQTYGIDLITGKTLTSGYIGEIDCADNATGAFNVAGTLSGIRLGFINSFNIRAGSPESVVTAPIGTLFRRTDGSTSTTLYVKESGTGNTGWIAK